MSQVVTELVIDSAGAASGAAQYERAMQGAEKASSSLASQVADMSVAIVGVGLAVGAGLAALRAFVDYVGTQSKIFADMEENAARAGMSLREFQETMFAARASGVSERDFLSGISKIGDDLAEAAQGATKFGDLFRANGVSIRQANGELKTTKQAIADIADMMEGKTPLVQQGMARIVGLSKEWIPFLRQGADAIDAIKARAEAAGVIIDDISIRKAAEFSKQWNLAAAAWDMKFRASLADLMPLLIRLAGAAVWILDKIGSVSTAFTDAMTAPVDMNSGQLERRIKEVEELREQMAELSNGGAASGKQSFIMQRDASRLLGIDTATLQDADRQLEYLRGLLRKRKEIEQQSAGTDSTGLPKDADAYSRATDQLEKHINRVKADAEAVGLTTAQHAKLRAEADLTTAALKAYGSISPELAAGIRAWGDAAAEAAQKLERAKNAYAVKFGRDTALLSQEDVAIASQLKGQYASVAEALASVEAAGLRTNATLKGIGNSIENNLVNGLSDIASGAKSLKSGFSDMANSILRDIEKMIIKMLIVGPLMQQLQALLGAFGGPGNALPAIALPGGGYSGPIGPVAGDSLPAMSVAAPAMTTAMRSVVSKAGNDNAPRVQVNIVNNSGEKVERRQSSQGGIDIHDIVIGEFKRAAAGGEVDDVMGRFSVSPGTRRR